MRFSRHVPPPKEWHLPALDAGRAVRWLIWLAGAGLAGYLVAFFLLFPAPMMQRHQVVPRVLGMPLAAAETALARASLQMQSGGSDYHPTAPQGTVIWQDPPPDVLAPAGLKVQLVTSDGPPRLSVPDVSGLDGIVAQRIIAAAGLTVSRVDSVQAPSAPGVAMQTRPAAGSVLTPGATVVLVVSEGAPTIPVPDLLNLSQADARTRLEIQGLALGSVTRKRTTDASPGIVIAQKPSAGTLAAPGTVVDIVVARSPQ
ncbi:MAG TPA: PASTA domain-containing protein [Gemmatimonadales bacterium]|nr:PASTA domain-containing protein [Gemmatimonadales bacterium]